MPIPPAPGAPGSSDLSLSKLILEAVEPCGTAHVVLAGELDASNCESIATDVERLCRSGYRRVLIHLDEVTFLDAATIDTFVAARRRAGAVGADVVLRGASGEPLCVLRLVGLESLLFDSDGRHD